ncbi:hypothetical protein TPADAL_0980a [Treponema pallidum subsp. pallidum DAL-1]|uniref:Uncharacterized protein n=2 Tax=Treponema pallidum TaxID=160 RepID=A0AAU8S6S3_TREPL|nr:hypothetical protein TPESAMD_0980a [Treponema pallidum subsp. pertenue str. SamoaD]AEZ59188.1 hypothetical protein TPECDC2_0980a [Treponema pallidum subsp. pertenue str. CDC2]AEZ60256.1 hypothetical protein TPEGAU_0980a [Treponema pallidum subsp. pertenue str. Gauthier]AEZ61315.1 hypothetical protein TPADAL_0980a [Treponema pallidum subsp. pallidum DAL-1]AGK84639.1 hypothetical protein TPFB_0980a [Treponema pallidum str. Fribourg-Blanc]AJB41016.1 hypothetical protein TENDBA_0980a [Treponema
MHDSGTGTGFVQVARRTDIVTLSIEGAARPVGQSKLGYAGSVRFSRGLKSRATYKPIHGHASRMTAAKSAKEDACTAR